MRADQLLVQRNLASTRSQAQRLIADGVQWLKGAEWKTVTKNGDDIPLDLSPIQSFSPSELILLKTLLRKGINSPVTSSAGRLFDAVAALVGLRNCVSYEGQAALELEMAATESPHPPYPFTLCPAADATIVDMKAMIATIVADLGAKILVKEISARFHATLVAVVVEICSRVRAATGVNTIALSGGVFQNRLLTEGVIAALQRKDFMVLTHSLVPPNDGGLSLGQAVVAAAQWQDRN